MEKPPEQSHPRRPFSKLPCLGQPLHTRSGCPSPGHRRKGGYSVGHHIYHDGIATGPRSREPLHCDIKRPGREGMPATKGVASLRSLCPVPNWGEVISEILDKA